MGGGDAVVQGSGQSLDDNASLTERGLSEPLSSFVQPALDPVTKTFGATPDACRRNGLRFDMGIGRLQGIESLDSMWAALTGPSLDGIGEYPGTQGEPEFLEAMASLIEHEHGHALGWDRVVATHGAFDGVAHALACLPAGSPVLHPLPGFDITPAIRRAGHLAQPLRWTPYEPVTSLLERLEAALVSHRQPVGVIVNFPSNPGGQCPTPEEWSDLLDMVDRARGLLVVDDAYGFLVDNPPALYEQPNVMLVESFSKRLGAPGLRLGAAICPTELVPHVRASVAQSTVGIARPLAVLGAAALRGYVASNVRDAVRAELNRRERSFRSALHAQFRGRLSAPGNALYLAMALPEDSDAAAVTDSLHRRGLAATPGSALVGALRSDTCTGQFLRFCLGGTNDPTSAAELVNDVLVDARQDN